MSVEHIALIGQKVASASWGGVGWGMTGGEIDSSIIMLLIDSTMID